MHVENDVAWIQKPSKTGWFSGKSRQLVGAGFSVEN
jgi:hypothetical protein